MVLETSNFRTSPIWRLSNRNVLQPQYIAMFYRFEYLVQLNSLSTLYFRAPAPQTSEPSVLWPADQRGAGAPHVSRLCGQHQGRLHYGRQLSGHWQHDAQRRVQLSLRCGVRAHCAQHLKVPDDHCSMGVGDSGKSRSHIGELLV